MWFGNWFARWFGNWFGATGTHPGHIQCEEISNELLITQDYTDFVWVDTWALVPSIIQVFTEVPLDIYLEFILSIDLSDEAIDITESLV